MGCLLGWRDESEAKEEHVLFGAKMATTSSLEWNMFSIQYHPHYISVNICFRIKLLSGVILLTVAHICGKCGGPFVGIL